MYQSKYFSNKELTCQDGCGLRPRDEIIMLADHVREEWGAALNCASGARCMAHTLELRKQGIPAALHSKHMELRAIDLSPANKKFDEFHEFCVKHLEQWSCWMEDPRSTPSWSHLQDVPYPGWKSSMSLIFKP